MPVTLEVPNKELTPQMERHSGGRSGRRKKRMVWRRKGVADGRRKGGELRAVESGTALCSLLSYAPALPPPQHPHLHPYSLPVWPLLHSGLAGMLTSTPTHPPPLSVSHPSFSYKIRRNKGEAATHCYKLAALYDCLWMWIMFPPKVTEKKLLNQRILPSVLMYFSRSATVWLKISLQAAEGKSDSTWGSIKTHRFGSADLSVIPVRIIPASRAGVCTDWDQEKHSNTVSVEANSSKSNLCKICVQGKCLQSGRVVKNITF